jgi:hypothetical protein
MWNLKARAEDDWRRRMPTDFERKKKLQVNQNELPCACVRACVCVCVCVCCFGLSQQSSLLMQYIEANEDPSGSVWYCNRCVLVDAEFVTATACCSCSATRHCRTTEDYDSEDSDAASV